MSSLAEIQEAIEKLASEDRARLREWFDAIQMNCLAIIRSMSDSRTIFTYRKNVAEYRFGLT
jgi:hypothetical protein